MDWRSKVILLLATAGLVGGVVALITGRAADGEAGKTYAQGVDERRFVNVAVEEVEWTHDPHAHLLYPTQVEVHADRIYVLDQGDLTLKAFDLSGRLVATIGRGRGEGPGELQTVMDFFVRDGRVWMLDGRERRVSIFRTDGSYLRRFLIETDGHPSRFTLVEDNLIVKQVAPAELFLNVDTTGQVLRRFGDLAKRFDVRNPLAFGGELVATEDGVVFGASKSSYLHYFDLDGNFTRTVRTIDKLEYEAPPPEEEGGTTSFSPPDPPIQYRSHTIQQDTLKINAADYENRRSIIDYYTADGKYLGSVQLPKPATLAYPYHGSIIANYDTTLTKYRIGGR